MLATLRSERDGITRPRRGASRALRIGSRDFRGMELRQAERRTTHNRSDLPFLVVGTGVDPVTFRFSGGRSAD